MKTTEQEKIINFLNAMNQLMFQAEEQPIDEQLENIEIKLDKILQKLNAGDKKKN